MNLTGSCACMSPTLSAEGGWNVHSSAPRASLAPARALMSHSDMRLASLRRAAILAAHDFQLARARGSRSGEHAGVPIPPRSAARARGKSSSIRTHAFRHAVTGCSALTELQRYSETQLVHTARYSELATREEAWHVRARPQRKR